jgi:hypothetical protein
MHSKNPVSMFMFISLVMFMCGCELMDTASDSVSATVSGQAEESIITTDSSGRVSGSFSTLTYNVAGLLEPISSSSPSIYTPVISCLIRDYDIAQVQEDFNYHAALYDTCDNHLYRSSTSGGMGIGSGLNQLSNFPYMDWERVTWTNRSGSDALTPKGFTMARTRIAEGVYVDFYNLHAQSETTDTALANSRSDILQLLAYIEANSAGNAVIVMGDTNTRYTRSGQNIKELLIHGFTDVWIQLMRGGNVPEFSANALTSCGNPTSGDCEVVDKVLYRSSRYITLTPVEYLIENEKFIYTDGSDLSDHWPLKVSWNISTVSGVRMSDQFGGPHGTAFNDVALLPQNPAVSKLSIRTGSRVDTIGITLSAGGSFSHGGTGGSLKTLSLASGEYLTSVKLCSGIYNGTTRIFYAKFTTNKGRTLAGGSTTGSSVTYTAPSGWQIVGFHGRSANEVDKIGVIYAPRL